MLEDEGTPQVLAQRLSHTWRASSNSTAFCMADRLFMFLTSTRVLSCCSPFGRTDTLTSHLMLASFCKTHLNVISCHVVLAGCNMCREAWRCAPTSLQNAVQSHHIFARRGQSG